MGWNALEVDVFPLRKTSRYAELAVHWVYASVWWLDQEQEGQNKLREMSSNSVFEGLRGAEVPSAVAMPKFGILQEVFAAPVM